MASTWTPDCDMAPELAVEPRACGDDGPVGAAAQTIMTAIGAVNGRGAPAWPRGDRPAERGRDQDPPGTSARPGLVGRPGLYQTSARFPGAITIGSPEPQPKARANSGRFISTPTTRQCGSACGSVSDTSRASSGR